MLYDRWLGPGPQHKSKVRPGTEVILLQANVCPRPPPPCPFALAWMSRGQEKQRTPPACSVPRVTPDLPTLSQCTVHVPLWCLSPRARLEFGAHQARCYVDFWACLLLVKQTGLDLENKVRLINNEKSHNSPQENLHVHLMQICSIALC